VSWAIPRHSYPSPPTSGGAGLHDSGRRLMGDKFFLYRWFRDVSIARKLYFTVGTMALLIGVELFVLLFSLNTLSSLRAYVGGEGLWSKAQKDAVFHLYRYGVSHTDNDYQQFQQFMRIPVGDAKARQALLTDDRNRDAARDGFLEGRNHPDDIDGMISLFSHFDNIYYIKKAISVWGDAQAIAIQLLPIAEELHKEINSPNPSQDRISAQLASVYAINEKLTVFEDEFSFTLGEGSRWLERIVLRLLFATALTVEATGLLLIISVSKGIQRGLADIIRAANLFSTGEWSARAKVLSHNEIGVVANAFNEMADNLQIRMRELAQLNEHLRHEIDERERAEAVLRRMNGHLELRVAERTARLTHLVDALRKEAADRERAEATLRQSQKMDAVGQLTGGIAHDFNNMLAGISGGLEMISRRLAQGRTAGLEGYIEAALTSAARAATLTHRLLAFSRRQTLDPKPTDMNLLVLGMQALFSNTLGPAIQVRTTLDPHLWSTLCDPNQLENALLNLIINARDAMSGGGSLLIGTENWTVPDRSGAQGDGAPDLPAGDYVALTVTDSGVGMAPAVLARAFDPFFTTKPLGQGTGLGLSMVYGFVQQSGGQVLLRSKEGHGTTATIYLPRYLDAASRVAAEEIDAAPDTPEAPANAVVLVVEDEPDVRMVVVDLLEDIGYTVLVADDGASGLKILDSKARVDLLVTDVGLPGGINGRQLADAARQRRLALKVLFITGYAEGSAVESGLLEEGMQVLTKPFSLTTFAAKVQGIING
jgi:signal transduction histidine kinase/CheY-like chemotaxis protein